VKKPIPVGPGVHTFAATLDGHTPASKELRVVSGESKELKLELMPVATKPGDPVKPAAAGSSGNYSTPMMVAGIVSGSLGLLTGVSGIFVYAVKEISCPKDQEESSEPPELCDDDRRHAVGATMMVIGGVLVAAGIPMFIVGAGPGEKKPTPPRTARPQVLVGPGSAALRWSF
jgi:hypothetical protein